MPMTKLLAAAGLLFAAQSAVAADCPDSLRFELRPLTAATPVDLCERYVGKVLLVVNTASRCVYTPQYEGLMRLADRYGPQGLVVLGFPSNDFGNQEPGSAEQIAEFCRVNYGVNFPMFAKIRVTGSAAHPFYKKLTELSGEAPKWNFHKYLIGRDGKLIANFPSHVTPDDARLAEAVERALGQRRVGWLTGTDADSPAFVGPRIAHPYLRGNLF